ncbi:MAG: hypothetical protein NWE89_05275 [Candidatus Bathyarchaeota archaeon]|nr:hypothetical protein [Candidatus Bathyarchaeota archaeon]
MYEVRMQSKPEKELQRLKKRAKPRWERITERMNELGDDPIQGSIQLKGPILHGFRKVRAGDDRIIYQICEECRDFPDIKNLRQCFDCDDISDNWVMVFDIEPRKSSYKKHKHRR